MKNTKHVIKAVCGLLILFAGVRIIGILGNCSTNGCGAVGDSYDNAISRLKRTDPKLVHYKEINRIRTGLTAPRGIALDGKGNIYIVGDKSLLIFNKKAKRIGGFRLHESPYCVSVSPKGEIYMGMRRSVEVYDSNGKGLRAWPHVTGRPYITSISAGKDSIWVADAGNRIIYRYTAKGEILTTIGKQDSAKHGPVFIVPSPHLDVSVTTNDAVWVTNPGKHQLELYTTDGKQKRKWGKTAFMIDGFSGCCNPTDFAILKDGRFVTSEKGIPRVKVYTAKGKFDCVVAGSETFAQGVVGLDLATDTSGQIYILDPATRSVRVYTGKATTNRQ